MKMQQLYVLVHFGEHAQTTYVCLQKLLLYEIFLPN